MILSIKKCKKPTTIFKKRSVGEGSLTTDAAGKGSLNFPVDAGRSYRVELKTGDLRGNQARVEVYLRGADFYREYDYHWYRLEGKDAYKAGERVQLILQDNETAVSPREKSFLFMTAGRPLKLHS